MVAVGENVNVNDVNAYEERKSGDVSHERPRFVIGRSVQTSCLVAEDTQIFRFGNSDAMS